MTTKPNRRLDHQGQFRTAFEKNRKLVLSTAQVCGICGNFLDPSYKYPHPLSTVVDHIIPINKGGHPSDLANLQAAHRWCNRQKSDKLIPTLPQTDIEEAGYSNLPLHFDWFNYQVK